MLITITLISGLSMAEDANVSINESEIGPAEAVEPTVAEDVGVETAAPEEAAISEETAALDLKGSWILIMDDERNAMVIYQSEDLLFGAASSETPKPWNGVVSGSVSGEEFELQILSFQDGVLVSTLITGTAAQGDLSGSFVQSDSNGKVNIGSVTGILTSPDPSGYEPADVPVAVTTTTAAAVTPAPESAATEATTETTEDGRKKPVDVTTYGDQINYWGTPIGTV